MKNLIITIGIMILMMTGLLYDLDCNAVFRVQHRMEWVCEDMAEAAWYEYNKEESTEDSIGQVAEAVLARNKQNLLFGEKGDSMTYEIQCLEESLVVTLWTEEPVGNSPFLAEFTYLRCESRMSTSFHN